jgi:hypothetical protein
MALKGRGLSGFFGAHDRGATPLHAICFDINRQIFDVMIGFTPKFNGSSLQHESGNGGQQLSLKCCIHVTVVFKQSVNSHELRFL